MIAHIHYGHHRHRLETNAKDSPGSNGGAGVAYCRNNVCCASIIRRARAQNEPSSTEMLLLLYK